MPRASTEFSAEQKAAYDARNERLSAIIGELPRSIYGTDVPLPSIETFLSRLEQDYGLNLYPDFQRGHVWTQEQSVAYIEAMLQKKVIPLVKFNVPQWENDKYTGDLPREAQVVDGLQRLTAVRAFVMGEFRVFDGRIGRDDLKESRYDLNRVAFKLRIEVFDFQTKAELLSYYLGLNAGGTPHATAEIERVRKMLAAAQWSSAHAVPGSGIVKGFFVDSEGFIRSVSDPGEGAVCQIENGVVLLCNPEIEGEDGREVLGSYTYYPSLEAIEAAGFAGGPDGRAIEISAPDKHPAHGGKEARPHSVVHPRG